jgi:hypothetical protein
MHILENLSRFITRFRYPVTLPEDLANDLGLPLSNSLTFQELMNELAHPTRKPKTLCRWMRRSTAEKVFQGALKKEVFCTSSLFSYYFAQGWLVFALYFDENSNLRRLYVQCPSCEVIDGFDIPLIEYFEDEQSVAVLQ